MILSFINIRKVPREASPSVFNTSLGTLQMLMNGKSCLIPLLTLGTCKLVIFMGSMSHVFDVIAAVARLLHFVKAS